LGTPDAEPKYVVADLLTWPRENDPAFFVRNNEPLKTWLVVGNLWEYLKVGDTPLILMK